MKRVLVKSVYDAFEYVMEHYAPHGLDELAARRDTYAVISIQDSHNGGFGFVFEESACCKGVLTLYFDDVIGEAEGAAAFCEEDAREIIDFIRAHRFVDTLLLHCYAGESRSMAVGAFATKMLGGDETPYFTQRNPNRMVYDTLLRVWNRK